MVGMADLDTNLSDFGNMMKKTAIGPEVHVIEARYDPSGRDFHVLLYEKHSKSSAKLFQHRGSGKTLRAALNRALDEWFF